MSRSSPRSRRCIWNSSARSRRSPTPRRKSFAGVEPGGAACSTATIAHSSGSKRAARGSGRRASSSLRRACDADARLIKVALQAETLDACRRSILGAGRHLQARRAGPPPRRSIRSPCWRRRRSPAPISRWRRWRSPTCSRRPAAARASRCDLPGGAALLIDESYNANPASMRAALALLGQAPTRVARPAHRRAGRHAGTGRQARQLHRGLGRADRGQRGRSGVLLRPADEERCGMLFPPTRRGGYAETSAALEPQVLDAVARRRRGDGQRLDRLEAWARSSRRCKRRYPRQAQRANRLSKVDRCFIG